MKKFSRVENGYDPDEVNAFLDQVISHVEKIVEEMRTKDIRLKELETNFKENNSLKEKLEQYERMEDTLNKAILMAQKTSDQIKGTAYRESELVVEDAKRNASRIVNEALLDADKIENEAAILRRNVSLFKRRLKMIIEEQLEMVNDIEKVDF